MADYTVTITDVPDHKRGDKWPGIEAIGPVLVDGVTPEAALARIRMTLVHASGAKFRLDSDTTEPEADAPIVISNEGTTWAANIPPVQEFLPLAGVWEWDMEFYATGDTNPLTFYQGQLTVNQDRS